MNKNTLVITFVKILLLKCVLSFGPFEDNKEYSFKVEWEDKAFVTPIGRKMSRFFHADMFVRKSADDHLLIMFKNVSSEGYDIKELQEPFKLKVVDHEIKQIITTGQWTRQEVDFKNDFLEEFVKDYSNITKFLNNTNWQDDTPILLPIGECNPDVNIKLYKNEIILTAKGTKANCILTDEILGSVPTYVDINRALSEDSDGGVKVIFDRTNMQMKEIEIFADLEIFVEVRRSSYTVKTRMSYEYTGTKDVTEKIHFNNYQSITAHTPLKQI